MTDNCSSILNVVCLVLALHKQDVLKINQSVPCLWETSLKRSSLVLHKRNDQCQHHLSHPPQLSSYYDKLLHLWDWNASTHFMKHLPCGLFFICMLSFPMSVKALRLYSTHHLHPSHHQQSPFFLSSIFLSADTTHPKLKSILYGVWLHTLNCYVKFILRSDGMVGKKIILSLRQSQKLHFFNDMSKNIETSEINV